MPRLLSLAGMRRIRAESDRCLAEHRRLAPRNGEVAVGGAHFDAFLRGEALAELLRRGVDAAKALAAAMVRRWNARREWQVHRWEGCLDAWLDGWEKVRWEAAQGQSGRG